MGYLIQNSGELVKITKSLTQTELLGMGSAPILIADNTSTRIFCVVNAFLQIESTGSAYSGFTDIQLTDGATLVYASLGITPIQQSEIYSFICSLRHPVNQFGARYTPSRDIYLKSNVNPTAGSGDGLITMYGYYINVI
jgi:hypothetical protein